MKKLSVSDHCDDKLIDLEIDNFSKTGVLRERDSRVVDEEEEVRRTKTQKYGGANEVKDYFDFNGNVSH